ncbi:hypothetical protein [Streptomyces luteocolor]|uniref:hypothetical protein n=1 Tax=Streptomyces luteocolor TaxID=285500 RepID=UPI0008537EEF|nr:hypothetical protein [Streptomyces luteocolor]
MRVLDLAAIPPAGAATYGTIVALQHAGMSERPAHALGAVAIILYLALLTTLIDRVTTRRTGA